MKNLILFAAIIVLFALGLWWLALLLAAMGVGLGVLDFFDMFNPKE